MRGGGLLHEVVEGVSRGAWDVIVDVAAGDGRHAVAVAQQAPRAIVHAFEPDAEMRRALRRRARAGGVARRLGIAERCRPDELDALLHGRALLICHGERTALALCDHRTVPALHGTTLAVALRDGAGAAAALRACLTTTHALQLADAGVGGWTLWRPRGAPR